MSPAQPSRSLSKFLRKVNSRLETIEHTCSEYLRRSEIILRSATKFANHIDGSLGKTLLKNDLKGEVKMKHISPKKFLKIQTKDNADMYMELTAMLAAILTAILDPKNIFRFIELILKNKVVLAKY